MTKADAKKLIISILATRKLELANNLGDWAIEACDKVCEAKSIMERSWETHSCECHNAFPVIHEKDCPNREVNKILAKREKDSC